MGQLYTTAAALQNGRCFFLIKNRVNQKTELKKIMAFAQKLYYTVVRYCVYKFNVGGYFLSLHALTNEINNFFHQKTIFTHTEIYPTKMACVLCPTGYCWCVFLVFCYIF